MSGLGRQLRRSRSAGRSGPARVDDGLPAEGDDDRAAHTAALARDAIRGIRSQCLHPNDQFFVRWHWAVIPEAVDVAAFKIAVRGHVNQALSLSLADLLAMPRTEVVAVGQCSGNSRGLFQPRVSGAQWQNGAMGNARWTGVRLRDVLDRAGVKAGAVAVRSSGLDDPVVEAA